MFIDPIFSLGSQCLIATQVANSFGLVCIVTNAVPGWVDKTIKTPSFQRVDMTDIGIDMNRYGKDIAIQCNSIQFIPYLCHPCHPCPFILKSLDLQNIPVSPQTPW